ncbi:MAG TPA: XdhC family protein [Nitrososphaerales archaeon]|nr:XdhC family protein [Nitrososphaerales archaeon]
MLRQLELGSEDIPFVVVGVLKTKGPTAIKTGNKAIILGNGSIEGWVGGHCTESEIVENALECLKEGASRSLNLTTCQGGRMDVYLEPYLPKRRLVIFGHVPIASALSRLAKSLNFNVTIVDKGLAKDKFPDADLVLGSFDELKERGLNPLHTFAVIVTMGERDQEYAQKLAKLGIPYIGVVAGRKRASEVLSYLRAVGLTEAEIARVKSPAGIYIRAVTAEEIALSIMSEIIDHARASPEIMSTTSMSEPTSSLTNQEADPICGMLVDAATAENSVDYQGKKVYFCSESCKDTFVSNPEKYILQKNKA